MKNLERINNPEIIGQAIIFIEQTRNECMVRGANDFEPSAFADLLAKVRDGSITPEEAKKQAAEILASKQDYH